MQRPPAPGLRVLGGSLRGRRLRVPAGRVTRPARALVRRSVFDILRDGVRDATWLDLYAGSGSFGIEAYSRGCRSVTFAEAEKPGLRCLRRNVEDLGLDAERVELLTTRLPFLLSRPPPSFAPFDLISMDPPFQVSREHVALDELCRGLAEAGRRGWFAAGSRLIWEEPEGSPAPVPDGFRLLDERRFGTSRVRFLGYRA